MKELELDDIKQFFKTKQSLSITGIAREANLPDSFFSKLVSDVDHAGVKYTPRIKALYNKQLLPVMLKYGWDFKQRTK